jgi:hypothetical protein
MKIFDVVKDFGSLSLTTTLQSMQIVGVPKPAFEIPPYCIDRLEIDDLIIYKVPTRVHLWGVDFIIVNLKIYHYNFKKNCLCVRKVDEVLKPYVHIGN